MSSVGSRLHCRNLKETGSSFLVFAVRQIRHLVFVVVVVCLIFITLERGLYRLPLSFSRHLPAFPTALGGEPVGL